jgi:HlyD family secretion protein
MKRLPKWVLIAAGAVLIIIVVVFVAYRVLGKSASSSSTSQYQTAKVERGTLTATISATGNVRANQSASLNWQLNAKVGEVRTSLGQVVKKDDILVTLDPSTLPQTLIQAQSDLLNAQQALQDLYDQANTTKAKALDTLAKAQKALDDAQTKRGWYNNNTRADQYTIQKAEADYYLAKAQVDTAQEIFDNTSQLDSESTERAQAQSNLAAAQSRMQQAKWMWDYYRGKPDSLDINQAEAAVQLARAQVDDAQRALDKLQNGPDSKDIVVAQNRVASAQAAVNQTRLTAPFNGTITSLTAKSGDLVTPSTFALRIDDISSLYVDLDVSEVDINKVQTGQSVTLTFDAVPNKIYNGEVSEVGKVGTATSGAINFPVTVKLSDADDNVRPGMTAAATLTLTRLENVLMVPSRAVRSVSSKRVVYISSPGSGTTGLKPVIIEIGAISDTMVEITGGDLKEGDTVILNPPAQSQFGPGGGGANGGGRPGG